MTQNKMVISLDAYERDKRSRNYVKACRIHEIRSVDEHDEIWHETDIHRDAHFLQPANFMMSSMVTIQSEKLK